MAEYPPKTRNDMRRDLADPQGVPDWSPWDEYVLAGGSGRPESGPWPAQRYDLAWYWETFIEPLQDRIISLEVGSAESAAQIVALLEQLRILEDLARDRPGDGIQAGQAVTIHPLSE